MKTELWQAELKPYSNAEWSFHKEDYSALKGLLYFLMQESDEDEKGREIRVMALLNGETVCTNLYAYKLVRVCPALACDDCTDRGHCPEYKPGEVCVNDRGGNGNA